MKRSAKHSPGGAAVTEFVLALFLAHGRVIRAGDKMTGDVNLQAARWHVLAAIESYPKTVAQIAREYELTRQGILWVVQSMVKDGVVELIRNPDHRRAKLVQYTHKGREIYAEVTQRQRLWANKVGK